MALEQIESQSPNYYVAIGASAGGLEALQEFVQHMPDDSGAAFIVIQHLSPDFKSVMAELLGRHTSMEVLNAVDDAKVLANKVYLIPPRKNMMIAEGKLQLADQMPNSGVHFPIDIFFRSIAEDQHHRSMGVILSGTGSDGSRGILAIKEVGGLVLVQEPNSAKFDGMPYSAVKTGVVDVVAPARSLPEKIIKYITHPLVSGNDETLHKNVKNDEAALKEIYQLLKSKSDIDFTQYKPSTVVRRIERRMGIHGLHTLQEYYQFVLKQPSEMNTLSKDMLIGVTRFFRDDEPFSELEGKVIPDILDNTPSKEPIRIWVAGCSSGEEAYSMAIIFDEKLAERGESRSVKIFATDVDPDAIAEASAGNYSANVLADMSESRFKKYFTLKDETAAIAPHIRQMVVFATHNLMKDPPFSNTQLAICRNVLIYFQPKAQQRVLSMLHFSLKKNGYLFLGNSETLGELAKLFDTVNDRCRLYKKNSSNKAMHGGIPPVSGTPPKSAHTPSVEQLYRSYQRTQPVNNFPAINDAIIEDYAPPSIVLDADLEILHVYGDVTPYTRKIQPGKFSATISEVVNPDLQIAVSTAVHRANAEETNVQYDKIQLTKDDGSKETINLRVRYVKHNSNAALYYFIILFENPQKLPSPDEDKTISYNANEQVQQRIIDLESQLHQKQEHLQVTIEELETTNEELQSSNEELMAANEELQSTNEELQSVNEELYTVNSEYQEKIEELTQVNADLDNIIKSTDIGIVFLDNAMLIRNYTPASTGLINLMPSDIGRPFHHISHQLLYDNLLKDISTVIEHGEKMERSIQTSKGSFVRITLTPYLDEFEATSGCVITLTDTTEYNNVQNLLTSSYSELQNTINTALLNTNEKVRVLIADDDKDDCLLLEKKLKNSGSNPKAFDIDTATSVKEAEEKLTYTQYDVCIMDYYMGSKTGLEIINSIYRSDTKVAFILLSGSLQDNVRKEALSMGVYDAIDKEHITPYLLERSIRYAVRHKKSEQFLLAHNDQSN